MAAVETRPQTVRAQAKWVHSSARKARLVTDLIRGRSVPEARTILAFSQRAVAKDIEKVLRSAVANAESRPDLHWNGDDLIILTAVAATAATRPAPARAERSGKKRSPTETTVDQEEPQTQADAGLVDKPKASRRKPKSTEESES